MIHRFSTLRGKHIIGVTVGKNAVETSSVNGYFETEDEQIAKEWKRQAEKSGSGVFYLNKTDADAESALARSHKPKVVSGVRTTENSQE